MCAGNRTVGSNPTLSASASPLGSTAIEQWMRRVSPRAINDHLSAALFGRTRADPICPEIDCRLRRMPKVRDALSGLSQRRWLELERLVSDDLDAEA